jgi:hypothetical protein
MTEDFQIAQNGPRVAVVADGNDSSETQQGPGRNWVNNPEDAPNGITVAGNMGTGSFSSVHTLTDVSLFARGPCQEELTGFHENVNVFHVMARCMGLADDALVNPTNDGGDSSDDTGIIVGSVVGGLAVAGAAAGAFLYNKNRDQNCDTMKEPLVV